MSCWRKWYRKFVKRVHSKCKDFAWHNDSLDNMKVFLRCLDIVKDIEINTRPLLFWRVLKKKKLFAYFNWRLTLQHCSGFCCTLTWISHGCECVPRPEPLSHLPPHPIPLGCLSALGLSALFHTSNLDCSSISHMVIDMFQCCSLT